MAYHESHERPCPHCGARISATAPKCLNCGEHVSDVEADEHDAEDETGGGAGVITIAIIVAGILMLLAGVAAVAYLLSRVM